jgi:hypothetical protein
MVLRTLLITTELLPDGKNLICGRLLVHFGLRLVVLHSIDVYRKRKYAV